MLQYSFTKFIGKERDAETGLDYFGARYMSSAQGRFTSPDPIYFQKEMLTDPQRWNLYAYARNNPLKYIDPKGEAIELLGDEEERKKALAALQKGVGAQAGAYLYENKVTTKDKNGNETTKYYVGIYSNGPDGKGPAFEKINGAAASLGGVIQELMYPFIGGPLFKIQIRDGSHEGVVYNQVDPDLMKAPNPEWAKEDYVLLWSK